MDDKLLSIGEASNTLGVSIDTLRRWEKQGKIPTFRSPGGHRYYKTADLNSAMNKKYQRAPQSFPIQTPVTPAEKPVDFSTTQAQPIHPPARQPPTDTPEVPAVNMPESVIKPIGPKLPQKPKKLKDLLIKEDKPKSYPVENSYEMSTSTFLLIALIIFSLIDAVLIYFLINMS